MNYPAFTNDSLTMMYEGIRGALAADDAMKAEGQETRGQGDAGLEATCWRAGFGDAQTRNVFRRY